MPAYIAQSPTLAPVLNAKAIIENSVRTVLFFDGQNMPQLAVALEYTPAMCDAVEAYLHGLRPHTLMDGLKRFDTCIGENDVPGALAQAEIVRTQMRIAGTRAYVRGGAGFTQQGQLKATLKTPEAG